MFLFHPKTWMFQIYIQDDGQVWDRLGKKNATFQGYYDCAIKAKKHLRRGIGARNTNKSPMKNKVSFFHRNPCISKKGTSELTDQKDHNINQSVNKLKTSRNSRLFT